MKKFRYGDPLKVSLFRKYSQFIYLFVAWNFFGVVIWKSMNANKKKEDSSWDEKTSNEKYLSLIGYGKQERNITRVKIEGLHVENPEEQKG
ncbi:hypothetical protein V1264_018790 [Littorina saxatilis]|uniref:Uncharacterized protein n=1 Tax=Littorina saxatilis TaxID=31220 RepID=A0AAN9GD81_9CAEN